MVPILRRLGLLLALVSVPAAAAAQDLLTPPTYTNPGRLSVQDAGTACSLQYSCAEFLLGKDVPSAVFGVTGTFSQTIVVEATSDMSAWTLVYATNTATQAAATSITGTGNYALSNPGWIAIRLRVTTYSSGIAIVSGTQGGSAYSSASFSGGTIGITDTAGNSLTSTAGSLNMNCTNCSTATTGTSNPASNAAGLTVRPLVCTDGTNNCTTQDAVSRPGFQKITDGTNVFSDPCSFLAPTTVAISNASATVLKLITKASSKKNYICALVLVAGAAEVVNIIEGTLTTTQCDTAPAALVGSTTAAQGLSFAANGGFVVPVKIPGIGTNVDTCLATSGSSRVSGFVSYVQQ